MAGTETGIRTWRLIVSGRVQGVFYRASAQETARNLGLTGWIRNRPDGRVEAIAHGYPDQLQAFTDWCRAGPPHADVSDVSVEPVDETPDAPDFEVVR